jgi:hypothetical protein
MTDLIQLLRVWDDSADTWWTRTINANGVPDKGDRVILWGTRETWLTAPVVEVERRNWLSDRTCAVTLQDAGSAILNGHGGAEATYEQLRSAGWRTVDAASGGRR